MNQREKLRYIIEQYENNKYITEDFCDLFVDILYHQKDGSISSDELNILNKLGEVCSRYSSNGDGVKEGFLFDEKQILKELQNLKIDF